MKRRRIWSHTMLYLVLTPLALLWLAPIWIMVVFATRADHEIFSTPIPLWPGGNLLENFNALQDRTNFLRALWNSLMVSTIHTLLALLITSLGGYAFARYRFFGRDALFGVVLALLTIPGFVVLVPQYILVARDFGLSNTYMGVILPALASSVGIFFMRQSFLSLPQSILDAARIDGAGELRIFIQIALPLVRSALAALAIILFLFSWVDFMWPYLILSSNHMHTAPVAISYLVGFARIAWGPLMVGVVLMTLPFMGVFLFLQKYFVAGITAGAVRE